MRDDKKPDAMELGALLCSKICHDIISPVGAINNGIEVLEDERNADMRDFALELIAKSAKQASAKLQFARIAFGAASSAGAEIDLTDAAQVLRNLIESDGKIDLDFSPPPALMAKTAVKLLFNLVMIGMNAIPRGGKMSISVNAVENAIRVVCEAANAKVSPTVIETIAGSDDDAGVDAHSIQPYYTALLAEELGFTVEIVNGDGQVTLSTQAAT